MTILFFARLFYPHMGGVETHVLKLSKELIKKGHRVIVVTEQLSQKKGSPKEKIKDNTYGITIYRIPIGSDSLDKLRIKKFRIWWWFLLNLTIIQKADIIHCHDVFFWYLPFRLLFPFKKVFTTFHGYETVVPPQKKAILIRKLSEKLSFGNICIGDYIKKWYATRPNYVLYGGVDKIQSSSPIKLGTKANILFVGRLEKDTGVLTYLKVLDFLKEKKFDFTFAACGDGSLALEIGKYGKAYGFVEDLDVHLAKTDIVFASSYLSILKALTHKKIVVATYDNLLKQDYLAMAPFAKWIYINADPLATGNMIMGKPYTSLKVQKNLDEAYQWVSKQTWVEVAKTYEKLWRE